NLLNALILDVSGDNNRLTILQEHSGGQASNLIDLRIEGDLNGGPLGAAFQGPASRTGLQPGSLTQNGFDNHMQVSVTGTANLFAFAQIGSGNRLHATIMGE